MMISNCLGVLRTDRQTDEQTDRQTDIGDCRVAFATENGCEWDRWIELKGLYVLFTLINNILFVFLLMKKM